MDTLMAGQPWFRTWASEALLSDDLDALTDHEFRIWFNLLCLGSLQEPRWLIPYDLDRLAKRCRSTRSKMEQGVGHMEALGMVAHDGHGNLSIVNGAKYNEGTRKPSDLPLATRDRKRDERDRKRDTSRGDVTPLSRPDVTLRAGESRAEQSREDEEEIRAAAAARDPLTDRIEALAVACGDREREPDTVEQWRLVCEDYTEAEVLDGIRELRRENPPKRPWPGNLRRVLPDRSNGYGTPSRNGTASVFNYPGPPPWKYPPVTGDPYVDEMYATGHPDQREQWGEPGPDGFPLDGGPRNHPNGWWKKREEATR